MSFEYSPYVLPLIAAALVSGWALFFVWPHHKTKSSMMLLFLTAGVTIWSIGYALEIAGLDIATKLLWGKFQYLGIAVIPVAWLFFALTYTNQSFQLTRRMVALLTAIPFITVLLTFTTEFHGLIWKEYGIFQEGSFSALELSHGAWFWVYWVYSQLLLLIGTVIIVRSLVQTRGVFRGQRILFFIAVLAPWIGNVLYITGNSPIPYLDLTPFAFTVSVASLVWAIFGFRLMDITPLARDRVVDSIREGMIVLDVRGNVVDINHAAAHMIGVPVANAIGKTAVDVFSPWSHLVDRFRNVMEAIDEISVGENEAKRRYEVRLSPLQDPQGQLVGRVIMLRAMDDEIPEPRFSSHSTAYSSNTQTIHGLDDEEAPGNLYTEKTATSLWSWLISYYFVPVKMDIPIPSRINPVWYRTRERIFTIFARIGASVGLIAVVLILRLFFNSVNLVFAALVAFLWTLGAARIVKYELRVIGFLVLIYGLALIETLNFGFSPDSFTFFLAFTIVAAVLTSRRGAISALAVAIVSLSAFFVLINFGAFIPLMKSIEVGYLPEAGISTLLVFVACASTTTASIVILLENLNAAWQKETQALNLLQQERDLLEQRIVERTYALAEARDEAEKNSNELRKYYRAIEQSGNTVIIMDKDGLIEYVNPKFVEVMGYSSEEALGKSPISLMNSFDRVSDFSQDEWWITVNAGQIWHGEFHNHRKDRSEFWESATIAPVLNAEGEVTNFVEIKQNITEQKILQNQLQKQNDYLSILHQITLDLLNRREIGDLLQVIVDRSAVLLDAPFSELMLEEDGELVVESFTQNQKSLKGDHVTRDQAILSWQAFDTHQPVVLEDYSTWQYRREIYSSQSLHATVDIPVLAGDRCLGILALGRSQPDYKFTPEQVETGILFARLVALVLDNASLYDSAIREIAERVRTQASLERSDQHKQVINSLLKISLEDRSMDEVLTEVLHEILSIGWLTLSPRGGIFLFNEQTDMLDLHVHLNLASDLQIKCSQVALGQCLCGRAALSRQIQFADCLDDRHEIRYQGIEEHGHYNVPILLGDKILGVIVLYLPPEHQKTEEDMNFLRAAADAVTVILRRKQAELLLQESEVRFRQIVENASDIIYRTDADGNFTYFNPTAIVILGYQHENEVLGRSYLDLAVPEWRHKVKSFYHRQFLKKKKNTYFEFPAVKPGGEVIWLGQSVQIVEDDNRIIGFQAVARDITRLVQAQEALALSRDQALDASRFKSQLVSRVSHELRTPLSGILGYAELLGLDAFGPLEEDQQDAVSNIIESTNYLANIVNDLLDESQVESKSLSLHYEYFNPMDLLEKIKASMSTLAAKKELSFLANISPDLPVELYGDIKRLQQVIINLTGNAIKFTKKGEVSVLFNYPEPTHWSIEVRDTGTGIPSSEHETVFEPFRQVSNSITRENRGSGLGLAIAKQLIELMDGQISLESQPGKGSLFTVTLPITNAPGE